MSTKIPRTLDHSLFYPGLCCNSTVQIFIVIRISSRVKRFYLLLFVDCLEADLGRCSMRKVRVVQRRTVARMHSLQLRVTACCLLEPWRSSSGPSWESLACIGTWVILVAKLVYVMDDIDIEEMRHWVLFLFIRCLLQANLTKFIRYIKVFNNLTMDMICEWIFFSFHVVLLIWI